MIKQFLLTTCFLASSVALVGNDNGYEVANGSNYQQGGYAYNHADYDYNQTGYNYTLAGYNYGYEAGNSFGNAQTANTSSVKAELLYFKPSMDQASFVISSIDNHVGDEHFPNGKRHINEATYQPGVRLEALYGFNSGMTALDLRGTYFESSHGKSVTGGFLYDTIGSQGDGAQAPEDTYYAGTAHIKSNYRYWAGDLTLNRLSLDSCFDNLTLLVGLHYVNLQQHTHFTSIGNFVDGTATPGVSNVLHSSSRFWGVGPQLGFDYKYFLTSANSCYGAFALDLNARGSLLCSNTKSNFSYTSLRTVGTAGVNYSNDDIWRVTPAIDSRLEGTYLISCGCTTIEMALGYEWIWYADSIDEIKGTSVAFPGDSVDYFSNFSLQGPYFRLGISF